MATHLGRVLFWAAVMACWGCSPERPPTPRPAPGEPQSGPVGPDLWKGGRGLRWRAETTIRVQGQGEAVRVIEDLREMDRTAGGDFRVGIRRRVPEPDGGMVEETFTAIAVGSLLWTRGSGGPFVAWEDPAEAIREFEGMALEGSADLWRLGSLCGTLRQEGGQERRVMERGPCEAAGTGLSLPGRLDRLDLLVERSGGEFRSLEARTEWTLQTASGPVSVAMEHRARADDLPPGEAPVPPREVVPARRERPVRMVRSILSGLGEWGPGAPDREKAAVQPARP